MKDTVYLVEFIKREPLDGITMNVLVAIFTTKQKAIDYLGTRPQASCEQDEGGYKYRILEGSLDVELPEYMNEVK